MIERAKARAVAKAARGHNRYCGPAALSVLTGVDTQQAARLLRTVAGRRAIRGVYTSELTTALARLGYSCVPAPTFATDKRPTLAQWLKNKRHPEPYLVVLSSHFCVIVGRRYIDNETGEFVALRDAPNRRARVKRVYRVWRERVVDPATVIPEPPPRDNRAAAARVKARKLAALHGVEIEVDHVGDGVRHLWVHAPDWLGEDADPFDGSHIADDWIDALERVERYAQLAGARASCRTSASNASALAPFASAASE